MNSGSQTLWEAVTKKESLVHPRRQMRIAHWNVRTMYAPWNALEADKVMEDFKTNILGTSKCRWPGQGPGKLG